MTTLVLGFDLGIRHENPSAAALLLWEDGEPSLVDVWTLAPAPSKARGADDWQGRSSQVLKRAHALMVQYRAHAPTVCFELPWVGENRQTAMRLADVGGGLRGLAVAFGVPCLGVAPTEAKQALTGDDKATKDAMRVSVFRQFGRVVTDHQADAVGVALSGRATLYRAALVAGAS